MRNPSNSDFSLGMSERSRSGLTIVELAAVLVIMALLATIVTGSVRQQARQVRERLAIQRLQSTDRELRRNAVSAGTPFSLWIDPARARYRVERRVGQQWELWRECDGSAEWQWELGASDRPSIILSRPQRLIYRPDGTSSHSFAVEVSPDRWLVVLSGTGESRYELNPAKRRQLLQPIAPLSTHTLKRSP